MSSNEDDRTFSGPSGSGTSGAAPVALSADHFAQLMSAITASQSVVDEKLQQFREEIRQGQEEAATKAVKRARYEKPYVFRKRGNEEQASFNAKVEEALSQAESDLSSISAPPAAIQRVKESIQKGRSLLEERQKLIRLADRSDHGWGVVDEYTADDLADDSDDEKRIERAEKAAERKSEKRRRKRGQASGKSRGGQPRFSPSAQAQVMGMPAPAVPLSQPRRQVVSATSRPIGPCHFCGEMGHLRLHCPAKAAVASRKWYPFHADCVAGFDVKHGVCKCRVAKGVNCIGVKDKHSTCERIESKGSVNCFDDRGNAVESDVSKVQSATVSSSSGRATAGVELAPSKHPGAESEGEDIGVECVDDVSGGGSSPPLAGF